MLKWCISEVQWQADQDRRADTGYGLGVRGVTAYLLEQLRRVELDHALRCRIIGIEWVDTEKVKVGGPNT
jgi:hypothetical protein